MNHIKIAVSLIVAVSIYALIHFLEHPLTIKDKNLPPIGRFFNPFSGFWRNAEPIAQTGLVSQNIKIPSLKGKVDVVYDSLMIPHIFAENTDDAIMVQGYVTAQHRLWQMDILYRRITGRLSEVLGERTFETDRLMRRKGMEETARRTVESLKTAPESQRILAAYTLGVNAYIMQLKAADYPLEFKLLNYEPSLWTYEKSVLVIQALSENLNYKHQDLGASNALELVGARDFEFLYPQWNPEQKPIVPEVKLRIRNYKLGINRDAAIGNVENPQANETNPSNAQCTPPLGGRGANTKQMWGAAEDLHQAPDYQRNLSGSNNWAISKKLTLSGQPILANDPHLSLTLPSIWFAQQITTPDFSAKGVTVPGLPVILIGYNEHIAWGSTNSGIDVLDWFKIKWTDAARTTYSLDGVEKKATLRIEEFKIKGKPSVFDTMRVTEWGQLVYDFDQKHQLHDYAMHWISNQTADQAQFENFQKLNMGKSYEDYFKGISGLPYPAQNIVFAAKEGDIALRFQGALPIREKNAGYFLENGETTDGRWTQYVPKEHLPFQKNPARGYVFSANQHTTPPDYPYYYMGDFEDFRSRRIGSRLAHMDSITMDSMKNMQLDNFSVRAYEALKIMVSLTDTAKLSPVEQALFADLKKWNGLYAADATAPVLFDAWYDSTYVATWDELYPTLNSGKPVMLPEAWRFNALMKNDPKNKYFDNKTTPETETAKNMVTAGFQKMAANFTGVGLVNLKPWGEYKKLKIMHLSQIEALGRMDILVGGTGHSPNAITSNHGPSWRMIVELGDTPKVQAVYPGGQSGNPGSPYFDNQLAAWAKGEYYNMDLRKNVEAFVLPVRRQVFSK